MRRELEEMEAHGIIQPANSESAVPIVLVKKKDGNYAFVWTTGA